MLPSFKEKRLLFFIVPILSGLIFYSFPFSIPEVQASAATTSLSVAVTVCGNNIVEPGEQCDGTDLGGQTCPGLGYSGGTLRCKDDCSAYDTSGCVAGVPTWVSPVKETKVILQGIVYPEASITVLVDGRVVTIVKADAQANFKVELTTLTAGVYTFGLRAEDKEGRESITFSFTVTVSHKMTTTIGGIFIPPTIELEKTFLRKGEILNILGQTAPQSELSIHIESPEKTIIKKTVADDQGKWSYSLDTLELEEGFYSVKTKSVSLEELISDFSKILEFGLGKEIIEKLCPEADLNKDGKVDLIDFSILLYWWGTNDACSDQNQDGIVNLQDFSIMMYYWTG